MDHCSQMLSTAVHAQAYKLVDLSTVRDDLQGVSSPGYFVSRSFVPRYFVQRCFSPVSYFALWLILQGYFSRRYFVPGYFSPRYFVPGLFLSQSFSSWIFEPYFHVHQITSVSPSLTLCHVFLHVIDHVQEWVKLCLGFPVFLGRGVAVKDFG